MLGMLADTCWSSQLWQWIVSLEGWSMSKVNSCGLKKKECIKYFQMNLNKLVKWRIRLWPLKRLGRKLESSTMKWSTLYCYGKTHSNKKSGSCIKRSKAVMKQNCFWRAGISGTGWFPWWNQDNASFFYIMADDHPTKITAREKIPR